MVPSSSKCLWWIMLFNPRCVVIAIEWKLRISGSGGSSQAKSNERKMLCESSICILPLSIINSG